MSATQRSPSREEIDAWFSALLAGTRTRDDADRCAAQWHQRTDNSSIDDEVIWWALDLLHGIDMPAGPDGTFLHDDN